VRCKETVGNRNLASGMVSLQARLRNTLPQVKIVYKQAGRDNRPTGMKLAEDALQAFPKGQMDVIIGGNDELGLGALSAVEAAGRTEVLVTGTNGTADALAAAKRGRLALTVGKPSGLLGYRAVEQAIDYLNGKRDFIRNSLWTLFRLPLRISTKLIQPGLPNNR
jgi:ABC-type sugar transport system substrate-binding protein